MDDSQLDEPQIGSILVARGKIDRGKLDRALRLQGESEERLGALLVQLGLVAERDVAEALAEQYGLPLVRAADYPDVAVLEENAVSPEFLKQARALPVAESEETLTVALADPLDDYTCDALRMVTGKIIDRRVGLPSDIESAFQRQYGEEAASMEDMVANAADGGEEGLDDVQHLKDLASEAPIIRLVNLVISRALSTRASDIHVEPFEEKLKVRYRVDGVLRDVEAPPTRSTAAVISRIKVMANLNIAERRLPQDGRIRLRMAGKEVDMRISTVPTMHGESVVMRILDRGGVRLDFGTLGFTRELLASFQEVLEKPHGIILVTGPTGSGKTTTLYTALQALNTPDKKIFTVEDPVEYQLDGINQIQVNPQIGLSFANTLRALLRQDPDIMMVGEMRDLETAKIAVQAALTGHKVFSTLHTNDAASSVTRMLDMGLEDYLMTSTVNGILAQRLVRTLCGTCKESYTALPELVEELGIGRYTGAGDVTLYRGKGCEECEGTGYRGRISILELLVMTDPVRQAVLNRGDAGAILTAALQTGMHTMYEDGVRKSLAGVTTMEEVVRVTQEA